MPTYIEECDDYWIIKNDTGYGNALVLRTAWSSRYLDVIEKHKVKIIRLNEYIGWHGSDLTFLQEVPGIHGVDVLSEKVIDVSVIFRMEKLKTLSLYCKAKMAGEFTKLKHLQDVGLGWRKVYGSVFNLNTLLSVNVLGYPDKDLTRWVPNRKLERLRLESRELETLRGIERFPNIQHLNLYKCRRLTSLEEIGTSITVQELRISHCSCVRDLSPIAQLKNLRVLEIEDCKDIESVDPIGKCLKLERLQIAGNTTILNGDLSSLAALPTLKKVLLAQRKHYSHTDTELEQSSFKR